MLYIFGMILGIKLLLHGEFKRSLRLLILPVNYWRDIEYRLVYEAMGFRGTDKILDIGSPKLLSLYLAKRLGAEVFATDIEDYFVRQYNTLRQVEGIPAGKYHIQVEDGRHLTFANDSFNKVYAISVLEHIPGEGDTECIKEIARVLSQGGRCAITVPFSPTSKVEYRGGTFYWAGSSTIGEGGNVFYQRRYSEDDLHNRLIVPSGLKVKSVRYVGDRILTNSTKELSDYLSPLLGPLHLLLSRLIHTRPVDSWADLRKPLCALIVLEK
jgi:SAM-dependent methyltransferase